MYPSTSTFNRFPVIQPASSKVCHFSTFFCTFLASLGTPLGQSQWCYTDRKRPFMSYSEILVGNCNFPTPLHLMPPLGVFTLEFREKVWSAENYNHGATRQTGSEDSLTTGWAVSTQYQCITDRRVDVQPISRTCAVWLRHIKNDNLCAEEANTFDWRHLV